MRIYQEKRCAHIDELTDIPIGINFGQFSRENGCLALVYKNRGIEIQYLSRDFDLNKVTS